MDPQRMQAVLARIEAAAERIAIAARDQADAGGAPGDTALARRHARLRAEAGAALADLDQMILELGQ